ncbi:MAG: twin-arginine translocase TatA/TatE family subunit [Acidobacteriota bacterium]|nr:twin-arginine translocase TatA/TatE family subunit [Acidobacteriota bacterium]
MGLGLDNPTHIALLVVVLLLVFGAKRLPEIGRSLGSGILEFKQAITGSQKHESIAAEQGAGGPAIAGSPAHAAEAFGDPAAAEPVATAVPSNETRAA